MILQIIRLKSKLSEDDLLRKAKKREPQFTAIEGLLQKYYVRLKEPGQYGGVYIWDSVKSMQTFRESELAKSIPGAYEILEPPAIEMMDILFQLRP